ncbi:MAG: TrkH family potassium uptake protein [Gemmatimonadota bacterium]
MSPAFADEPPRRPPWWRRLTPPQLLVVSFAGLVVSGTLALWLLPGLTTGPGLSFVDALFTATSAICVTGLIVVDTATAFTPFGQVVLLTLIQLGGLGFLTLTTFVILALGGRASLRSEMVFRQQAIAGVEPFHLLRTIALFTFAIEFAGFLLLWAWWSGRFGIGPAAWHALFQAISAFCNAGFSTFSDSLTGFQGDRLTVLAMAVLIVVGGLGFLPVAELTARRRERKFARLSLHTKIVVVSTLLLLSAATLVYYALEARGELRDLSTFDRASNAFFMAVTPRTAGFNTVDYASLNDASLFFTVLLMLIGGSPGSTAGGFKTTTVFLLAAVAWSRWRGLAHTQVFRHTLPAQTVERAVGLVVGGLFFLGGAVFILMLTELGGVSHDAARAGLFEYAFEAVSAFGTVGLSTGVTSDLSTPGKLLISALMFLGRVGPVAVAGSMALAAQAHRRRIRYAEEDVIVG